MIKDVIETIDWQSSVSAVLLNPRLNSSELEELKSFSQQFALSSHVWVTSSGSSRSLNESLKLVAISKKAFLVSAQFVNQFLNASTQDRWGLFLPTFHVGGLAILARSFLSGSSVLDYGADWSAQKALEFLEQKKITLTSLVPTQLQDLVDQNMSAPADLRAVFVGGAHLEESLYLKARQLRWPILPSYGMTETASMIAVKPLSSLEKLEDENFLNVLPHAQVRVESHQTLSIFGESLLSGYAQRVSGEKFFHDPKQQGWYQTSDRALLSGAHQLQILGRESDFAKIKGEGVHLGKLKELWATISSAQVLFAFKRHHRDGHQVVLVLKGSLEFAQSQLADIEEFNKKCLPFERISQKFYLENWPTSAMGKPLIAEILDQAKEF